MDKFAQFSASLTPNLRLDHNEISWWYGHTPFQSVLSKFKNNLRI
jgi:hypothetical protein